MDDAIKKVRQLAASALVRKERLEEELAELEREKAQRESERDRAISADDDPLALQLTQLVESLGERVDLKRGEVVAAEETYREILGDLRTVQDAAKERERLMERAPVDAALSPDPFATTAEDAALENVRRHIEELSARAELEDELGAKQRADRELSRKLAELEKQEAEARARAQLAELKAKRKQKEEPRAEPTEAPDDGGAPPPPKKPKKTM